MTIPRTRTCAVAFTLSWSLLIGSACDESTIDPDVGSSDAASDIQDTSAGVTDASDGGIDAIDGAPDAFVDPPDAGDAPDAWQATTGSVGGRVFDTVTSTTLPDATVLIPEVGFVTTNPDGTFLLEDIEPGTWRMSVQLAGYAANWRTVEVFAGVESFTEVFVRAVELEGSLDAVNGGTIRSPTSGAAVTLPTDALVDEAGNPVQGDVQVALAPIDMSDIYELRAFSGGPIGLLADGTEQGLETFGVMDVVVTQDGNELDVAEGRWVTLSFPVFDESSPDVAPLWSLDESTGLWVEEGIALRSMDDDGNHVYEATVTHLTSFEVARWFGVLFCLKVCPYVDGEPAVGAFVHVLRNPHPHYSNWGYAGGDDGCATFLVPPQKQLEVRATFRDWTREAPATHPGYQGCVELVLDLEGGGGGGGGPAGSTECSGRSVDLAADPWNCGDCGIVCPATSCVGGVCGCPPDRAEICSTGCTDTQTDSRHCGQCEEPCAEGMRCAAGQCEELDCGALATACYDSCVDVMSDPTHCGACDAACNPGEGCSGGVCKGCANECGPASNGLSCEGCGNGFCAASPGEGVSYSCQCNDVTGRWEC